MLKDNAQARIKMLARLGQLSCSIAFIFACLYMVILLTAPTDVALACASLCFGFMGIFGGMAIGIAAVFENLLEKRYKT